MAIVEMCLGIIFICSMEYWLCFWCCKTRRKVVSIDSKWSYEEVEKVEMEACVVGRARDCVPCSLAKAMLSLEELNFGCHREFRVSGIFGEESLHCLH